MITDGAKPIRDYYEVNYTPFRLPFFDNFGDNCTVAAWAKGYQRAGIVPVILSDQHSIN
jgi:hypothetical protein